MLGEKKRKQPAPPHPKLELGHHLFEELGDVVPERMSEPCYQYLTGQKELVGLLSFIFHLTDSAAFSAEFWAIITEMTKLDARISEEFRDRWNEWKDKLFAARYADFALERNIQLLLQMWLRTAVDTFLTYISEILGLVFRVRPETLRTSETVRLDFILSYSRMDDLVSALADRRVERLSYQGMRRLTQYFKKRFRIELFEDEQNLERAVYLVELRNLFAHNRGIVNKLFLERVASCREKAGDVVRLEVRALLDDHALLLGQVMKIDAAIAEKFDIPRERRRSDLVEKDVVE